MKGGIVGSNVATLVPLVLLAGAGGLGSRYISDSVSGIATIVSTRGRGMYLEKREQSWSTLVSNCRTS